MSRLWRTDASRMKPQKNSFFTASLSDTDELSLCENLKNEYIMKVTEKLGQWRHEDMETVFFL